MKCPNCQFENPPSAQNCVACSAPLESHDETPVSKTLTTATPAPGLAEGSIFAGKYKIIKKLGRGGMGVVYEAEDLALRRLVAIKIISGDTAPDAEAKARFLAEAQAAAALNHPNICAIHQIDEAEGMPYIVMESIEGRTLRSQIKKGPLSIPDFLRIATEAAAGLEAAHGRGIVHRDIKSSNIMLTESGQVKIMDFGLAKFRGDGDRTGKGTAVGTVAYMSPEQVQGERADARSDIWSLGVVFYEMLTGELPFRGDSEQVVIHSILNKRAPRINLKGSPLAPGLAHVVERCLEKDPSDRYQSAAELRTDLARLAEGKNPKVWPRIFFRRAWPFAVGAVVVVAALMLFSPYLRRWLGPRTLPEIKTLAILASECIGCDEADKRFGIGLANDLVSTLSDLERFQEKLGVLPMSDILQKGITSPSQARRFFDVTLVIEVILQRMGKDREIIFNLVDARKPRTLRSIRKKEPVERSTGVYDAIVMDVVRMLDIEVQPTARAALAAGKTTAPGAYEYYRQGLGYKEIFEAKAEKKDLDMAIGLFQKALDLDPNYSLAHAGIAEAFWLKYESTRDPRWIEQAKASCRLAIQSDNGLAPGHVTLGIIDIGTGKYEEAVQELKQAIDRDPESFDAYLQLGIAHGAMNELDQAEANYKRAIQLRPYYWMGYSYLGVLYYVSARYKAAEIQFKQVIDLNPDNYNGYNCLGGISLALGLAHYDEARSLLEKSIAIKPNYAAYSNLGTIYFNQRQYQTATANFEKALDRGRMDIRIMGNLGRSYQYSGQPDKAKATFQKAIDLAHADLAINPRNATTRSWLASFYAGLGEFQKALAEITAARQQAPKDFPILRKCILVYELAGQRELALGALRDLVALGGTLEDLEGDPAIADLLREARSKNIRI